MIISIGAFADLAFANHLEQAAKESGRRIYLPSGAIGGLDVLKAATIDGSLDSVTLNDSKACTFINSRTNYCGANFV